MSHTPAAIELSRRAVACPRWRWMEGMREATGCRAGLISPDGMVEASTHRGGKGQPRAVVHVVDVCGSNNGWARAVPDLNDPATVGCLPALVREAWGDPLLHVQWSWSWSGWCIYGAHPRLPGLLGRHDTEAAALVAALESAP